MSRIIILGATGALGRHVLRQAVAAGHAVTVVVRTPSKLLADVRDRVSVHAGDLSRDVPLDVLTSIDCAARVWTGDFSVPGRWSTTRRWD
jgi:nucleoside-diphosphate-sugar epimerase